MTNYRRTLETILVMVLFGLMLTPAYQFIDSWPAMRLEEVLMLVLLVYLVAVSLGGQTIEYSWGLRQTLLLVFAAFVCVSILIGAMMGYNTSFADFNQLVRITKYLMIYTVALTVIGLSDDPDQVRARIMNSVLLFGSVLFIIVAQQYWNLFGLNKYYVESIADSVHGRNLIYDLYRPRPIGMIGNPNELGFLFVIMTITGVYMAVLRLRLVYLGAVALGMAGVLLSGSRSSVVAALVGLLIVPTYLMLRHGGRRLAVRVLGLATMLIVLGAAAAYQYNLDRRMFYRLDGLLAIESDASWQGRLARWDENIELFKASPLVGVGPLRRADDLEFGAASDNEWWLLLRSYGLAGTAFLLVAMVLPHLRSRNSSTKGLALALLVGAGLYMIPATVFHSLALMPLVLVLLALSDTTGRLHKVR